MAEDLAEDEEALRAAMGSGVKKIMKGKSIAVMKARVRELGVKDDFLIPSLLEGFDILGEIPPCGEFPSEVINATTSLDDLWSTSKWAQFAVKGVVGKPSERRDAPLKSCLEEVVAGGGLQGPCFAKGRDSKTGH